MGVSAWEEEEEEEEEEDGSGEAKAVSLEERYPWSPSFGYR